MLRRRCLNCGRRDIDRKTDVCLSCGTRHLKRAGFEWAYAAYFTVAVPIWLFSFVYGWWAFGAAFVVMFILFWLLDFLWPLKTEGP
ncbi:hypothetical protein [Inquilinus limosus]|uniref:DUF983 domain-containing protein n=1 Tax=Inquilinus limosus TaxID=171674 RepID=A0A211YSA3_9PROT|nr:hypothetical protein [Inquilinus limosus]OWJ55859.1 hypothetical protein BWR60_35835 [Inquilinus limosus]